jgi:hypothetical protein
MLKAQHAKPSRSPASRRRSGARMPGIRRSRRLCGERAGGEGATREGGRREARGGECTVVEESALVVYGPEVNPAISGLLASVAARNAGGGVLPSNSCGESIMVYLFGDCVPAVRYAAAEDDWCSVLAACITAYWAADCGVDACCWRVGCRCIAMACTAPPIGL